MARAHMHEKYKMVPVFASEGLSEQTSDYVCIKDAVSITIVITEDNLSGAGTAHNWSVKGATALAGTNAETITGISAWSETGCADGTILDTLAAATVTAGVFAADVTTTTWSIHVIEIDPAVLGYNATDGLPNDYIAIYTSATSANTNTHAVMYLETAYQQAVPPTAVT